MGHDDGGGWLEIMSDDFDTRASTRFLGVFDCSPRAGRSSSGGAADSQINFSFPVVLVDVEVENALERHRVSGRSRVLLHSFCFPIALVRDV